MANAVNAFIQARASMISQRQNAMRMEQFTRQQRRDQALRNALSQAYRPAQEAQQAVVPFSEATPGPMMPREAIAATPGGMDWQNAMRLGAEAGVVPEVMQARGEYGPEASKKIGWLPSSVREWQIYDKLPPEKKKEYLTMKRAAQYQKIGGVPTQFLPGQEGKPLSTLGQEVTGQAAIAAGKAAGKTASKDYNQLITSSKKIEEQKILAQDALRQFQEYSQKTMAGTGPFATGFGIKKYFSADTQRLEALFRTINLKNMAATFEGMSRAIDTQAERRAWEQTQPGIDLDDPVNYQIIIGILSLAAKSEAEALARRQYIEQSPGNTLRGYRSPVYGETKSMFDQAGNIQVVPNNQVEQARAAGMMTADEYQEQLVRGQRQSGAQRQFRGMQPKAPVTGGWAIKEIK